MSGGRTEKPRSAEQRTETETEKADPLQWEANLERLERQGRHLFDRLLEGERRYRRVARSVWQVQEQGRRELARELHDGLGQSLTAIKTKLEWLLANSNHDDSTRAQLTEIAELAGETLDQTRHLSRLLRPSILDDLGLEPALQWLARTMSPSTQGNQGTHGTRDPQDAPSTDEVSVTDPPAPQVETSFSGDLDGLSDQQKTLVFRIAQEALTNALRHARANKISLAVESSPSRLLLEVSDDGVGFEPSTAMQEGVDGFGVRGMQDRAEVFGGKVEISSTPTGTTVSLVLAR